MLYSVCAKWCVVCKNLCKLGKRRRDHRLLHCITLAFTFKWLNNATVVMVTAALRALLATGLHVPAQICPSNTNPAPCCRTTPCRLTTTVCSKHPSYTAPPPPHLEAVSSRRAVQWRHLTRHHRYNSIKPTSELSKQLFQNCNHFKALAKSSTIIKRFIKFSRPPSSWQHCTMR
jgi:hypothetical protein